jgi:hypothetical protein
MRLRLPGGHAVPPSPSLRPTPTPAMVLVLALGLAMFVTAARQARAHRLDECLQAARIAVATNRIDLFIDVTPGVAVAGRLLAVIDEDADGDVSEEERLAYFRRVLKDVRIALDGKSLAPRVTDASFPTLDEFRGGHGVIRIKASAALGQLSPGGHGLTLTNVHLATMSVYLVNALVPKDSTITITGQARDELQKGYRLEFAVTRSAPLAVGR